MNKRTTNVGSFEPKSEQRERENSLPRRAISRRPTPRLGREVQARIGQQLRAMYDEYVKEGVPPRIADLIHRLSEQY